MPAGWLTILKSVPWSEVISNAPKVAEGARKLWNAASKKRAAPETSGAETPTETAGEAPSTGALESRVAAVENTTRDLRAQMLASSELIKELAEQNGQLIARIEAFRRRVFWLTLAIATTAIVGIAALLLILVRS